MPDFPIFACDMSNSPQARLSRPEFFSSAGSKGTYLSTLKKIYLLIVKSSIFGISNRLISVSYMPLIIAVYSCASYTCCDFTRFRQTQWSQFLPILSIFCHFTSSNSETAFQIGNSGQNFRFTAIEWTIFPLASFIAQKLAIDLEFLRKKS